MGGRGTFAAGKQVAYTYETVGKVDGVKIINPIDKSKSLKLPEESHSSVGYVLRKAKRTVLSRGKITILDPKRLETLQRS